jgi:hypothetical protein
MNQPRECQKCGTLFSATASSDPMAGNRENCTVCGAKLGEPGTFVPPGSVSEVRPWMWFGAPVKVWLLVMAALLIAGVLLK